jgi:spermidine synthase
VTDDYPRIEHAPWVRPKEITRTLQNLLSLRTDPPVVGADDALGAEITRQRQSLMDFYTAGIAAYNGDREQWSQAMDRVLAADAIIRTIDGLWVKEGNSSYRRAVPRHHKRKTHAP